MQFDNLSNSDVFTFKLCHKYDSRRPFFAVIEKNLGFKEIEEIENFFGYMQLQFEMICGEKSWGSAKLSFTYEEMTDLLCTFFGAKALDVTLEDEANYDRQYSLMNNDIDDKYPQHLAHQYHLENLNEYPFYYCPLDMYGMRESRCSEGYSDEFNTTFQDRCKDDERIQQFFKDALKNPFRADVDFSSMNADVKSKYLN